MAAIEATMFSILIAMYFYLRLGVDVWPPPGTQLPHLTLPTMELVPLLISMLGSYWASEAAKKNDRAGMLTGMLFNVALALAAIGIRIVAWRSFNFNWATDVHGSIVWTILGLHTFDLVADVIFTLVLIAVVAANRCGICQRQGVHVDSIVWYFLVGIWLPLYVVVYWGPRIVGAPQ
jgi:cytochrome c oxidase subunit I+III